MNKTAGQRLREARGQRTRKEVYIATGIPVTTLSGYENDSRVAKDSNKIKLAALYGKTVQELFF